MIALVLDGIITCLLAVTIGYCVSLSRKITTLHQGRQELNAFLNAFNAAIGQAERNIGELKVLGQEADGQLIEHINKARYLASDLSFLMEKGENVADTLEHFITTSRNTRPRPPVPAAAPQALAPRPVPPKPSYREPAMRESGFRESSFRETGLRETGFREPSFREPSVREPVGREPVERERAAAPRYVSQPAPVREDAPTPRLTQAKQKALNHLLDQIAKRKEAAKSQPPLQQPAAARQPAYPAARPATGWESIASGIIPRNGSGRENGSNRETRASAEPANGYNGAQSGGVPANGAASALQPAQAAQKPFIQLSGTLANSNRASQEFNRQAEMANLQRFRQSIET